MIAVGILVAFFVGSILYIHFSAASTTTEEVLSSFSDEPAATETNITPSPEPEPSAPSGDSESSSGAENTESSTAESSTMESSFALKEFHRSETRDGKTLWEIRGERARYSPESKSVVIQKCRLLYLTKDDKTITITSDTADLSLLGAEVQRAVFQGHVVVIHDSGSTITTETAEYIKPENRIVAPGEVTIKGSWYETKGIGLEGDLAKNQFTLLEKVESKLDPSKRTMK